MRTPIFVVSLVLVRIACAQQVCVPIKGSAILGSDLAAAVPVLKAIPPKAEIGTTPIPGAVRLFSTVELQTIAQRFGITPSFLNDVCFRLATEPLDRDALLQPMMDALKTPTARIEIIETSNDPVPSGAIEFRRENLSVPANTQKPGPVMWKGDVIYAGGRRFSIWARVRITVPATRVVAVSDLRPGVPVQASQLRQEPAEVFPTLQSQASSIEEMQGLIPLRAVSAGGEVTTANLVHPNDVNRGDLVHVEVRLGTARVSLTGKAETAGRSGDLISVRNLESSRTFQARVDGAGSVSLQLRPPPENAR
jgi:flagella basal body P-ring formation protein FlgA